MYKEFFNKYSTSPDKYFFGEKIGANTVLQDFFNTMFLIYYTDIKVKRKNGKKLKLTIQVVNLEKFKSIENNLKKLIRFMSYEDWDFEFVKKEKATTLFDMFDEKYEKVVLLSGGLDSFTGTYFNKDKKTKYIGFNLNSREKRSQIEIKKFIDNVINNQSIFNPHKLKNRKKIVLTQRTRSLFFFALGIVEAYLSNLKILNIYENGIMSLNPPINFSRYTTKTTHPKTIYLFNNILTDLGLDLKIENTCINKTKAEMIKELPESYLKIIEKTTTCGVNRQKISFDKKYTHCGACVPCILRKITLAANDLEYLDEKNYQVSYGQAISKKFKPSDMKIDLFNEYKSAIMYFNNFRKMIENKEIYKYIDTLKKYYDNNTYSDRDQMLEQFKKELDYFFEKYPEILGKE